MTRKGYTRIVSSVVALVGILYFALCLPSKLFDVPYATVVSDRNGVLLGARIASDGQWRFPPRDTVPTKLSRCIIAFEDQHFYHHPGVNPLSIARAIRQNIEKGRVVSGGSTITMQTIRLARQGNRTIGQKLIEAVWALRLECSYSKDEILALYASHAPYGGNVVGIDAAAWRYFGHDADNLSWAEAALLAVLPNSPALIHLSRQRDLLKEKRDRLLQKLCAESVIDSTTFELSLCEPLPTAPHSLPMLAPHFVDRYAQSNNGQHVHSTIDAQLQQRVEELASAHLYKLKGNQINNLAAMVLDLKTDEVVAYCGGVDYGTGIVGADVDCARAPRCTGSILKPFLYYCMLRDGELLPRTLCPDVPINIAGYAPQNYSHQYEGMVHADEAIARSLNIPAVVMLRNYGVPRFCDELKQFGLTTLRHDASHYGLSLILGGAEATLYDVVMAYKRLAHYALGDSLVTIQPNIQGAAYQTFQALTNVVRPDEIDWQRITSRRTIGWKTGTSHGFRDAWAVGVTPRYVVGVWVGNATGEGRPGLMGGQAAAPLMLDIFDALPPTDWFECPEGMAEAEVCPQSGMLRGRFCPDADTVLITPNGENTKACPYHSLQTLTPDELWRTYVGRGPTVQRPWFVLPPVPEWYYSRKHIEYRPLPPFRSKQAENNVPLQFIYPTHLATIRLMRQMNGSSGHFVAQVAHRSNDAQVHWHLDGRYLGSTTIFHTQRLSPTVGQHVLTAVDQDGNTATVVFDVVDQTSSLSHD